MANLGIAQALGWRLARHGLSPTGALGVADVADRIVATRGWPMEQAAASFRARTSTPTDIDLAGALADGVLIHSYAFRGGSYLFTPRMGAVLLSTHTINPTWETTRFQQQAGFALDDWQPFREAIRDILATGPQTRAEISKALAERPALRDLAPAALGGGADTLYKPLHWWGDISFGPRRDGEATFQLLAGTEHWPGQPDADEALRGAIRAHLESYAPSTRANLHVWLTEGLSVPRRRVDQALADMEHDIASVQVEGEPAYVLDDDLAGLLAAEPTDAVVLLPGHDPWVMFPGTADTRLVPAAHRASATRGVNLVLRGGVLSGTWRRHDGSVEVDWFDDRRTG